ncbi:DUF4352 domain-containing protein [Neobittarella massiliensis]|uniref:DUF4352 domain-containing protein n=1 Tax=Neobittarella massiliensis (ex Bilen et al. 2018) TaxID=2041842 RepID=A0A8J6INK0_9FIRM|nr:DUF4352 domain-containing protein [Neobittarella massiliensis]MBC3516894.1 DUF4352 domain-containing protein [Neobittarella massiliensis]
MKKVVALILSVMLLGILVGCTNDTKITNKGPEASNSASAQTPTGNEVTAKDGFGEGRMGDIMHTYFFDYTVNSAYVDTAYEDYTPAEGNELLIAEVTVKNTSRESIEMYDTDFQCQWNSDGEDDYSFPITVNHQESSGKQLPETYTLAVNETVVGLLVFEVPEGNCDFSISYEETFESKNEGNLFFVYFTAETDK